MSLALMFSGQGTQHAQMLAWVDTQPAATPLLAQLRTRLGGDWRARLSDADFSHRNGVAQVLLTGLALAAWRCIEAELPPPAVVAGYSVGELAAFSTAGVFDATAALDLAQARADAMTRCVDGAPETGLMSASGVTPAAIEATCAQFDIDIAIELAADRCVLGGLSSALQAAGDVLQAGGARTQRLAVSLASHTRWMRGALPVFAAALAPQAFAPPRAALVCNLDGRITRGTAALRVALTEQLARPVRWSQCIESIAERRPRCVLEIGAGSALSKLWNDAHPDVPARSLDEFRSASAVSNWVRSVLDAG